MTEFVEFEDVYCCCEKGNLFDWKLSIFKFNQAY